MRNVDSKCRHRRSTNRKHGCRRPQAVRQRMFNVGPARNGFACIRRDSRPRRIRRPDGGRCRIACDRRGPSWCGGSLASRWPLIDPSASPYLAGAGWLCPASTLVWGYRVGTVILLLRSLRMCNERWIGLHSPALAGPGIARGGRGCLAGQSLGPPSRTVRDAERAS